MKRANSWSLALLALSLWNPPSLASELPDLTRFSFRGSPAFAQPQLALELFGVLPETSQEGVRKSGFATCTWHGRGISSWVECHISVVNPISRRLINGSIELLSMQPKKLRVTTHDRALFLQAGKKSEFIDCEITNEKEMPRQRCDFRFE